MNLGLSLLFFFCLLAVLFTFVQPELTLLCERCGRRVPWRIFFKRLGEVYTLPLRDWFNRERRNAAFGTPFCEVCAHRRRNNDPA